MLDGVIVFARLLQFGCALILFGLSLFCVYGFRAEARGPLSTRWDWPQLSVLIAATGALLGVYAWVGAEAALFFPAAGLFDPGAMWVVLTETGFGRITLMRAGVLALSIAVTLALSPGTAVWVVQSILGAFVVASFAWVGHGIYDSGWPGAAHTSADVLHLLAAGIWIGALVPLGILILRSLRTQAENDAYAVINGLERFSGIGPAAVSVLVLTGLVNSWFLIGIAQWRALFTTGYGIALTIKLVLFGGMLLLAAIHRYRLSPRLRSDLEQALSPIPVLRKLRITVATETGLSMAVLAAVAILGTWEPPIGR